MSLPITLQSLLEQDDRIQLIDDERNTNDGYWLYLEPGYIDSESGIHLIHEGCIRDLKAKVQGIVPCDCPDCLVQLGAAARLIQLHGISK